MSAYSEQDFRPRWAGPGAVIFSLVVLGTIVGGSGYLLWSYLSRGPSANEIFFGETLPGWWLSRARSEPPPTDVYSALPDPSLEDPLRQIDAAFGDAETVAVETIAFNQALESAELPFWVDVYVQRGFPIPLTYAIRQRDVWTRGEAIADVLRVDRLDNTNVVTGFTGRKGRDLPLVLLDALERKILNLLRDEAPENPVDAIYQERLFAFGQRAVQGFDPKAAREALKRRDRGLSRMENRQKKRRLRVRRPARFAFPYAWYQWMHAQTRRGGGSGLIFEGDLDAVRKADRALNEGPVGEGLYAIRNLLADVGSARSLHISLDGDLSDVPVPEELIAYYGEEDTRFRRSGHRAMRASLGAIRDSAGPACLALLETVFGASGSFARATGYHYGTTAATFAFFDLRDRDASLLAGRVKSACDEPDATLRKRAAKILERDGVPPARPEAD